MRFQYGFFAVLFISSVSLGVFAQQQTDFTEIALADFDAVWTTISENFVDPEYGGLNWEELRGQFRSKVEAAADAESAYNLIAEMIEKLNSPNTYIVPPWLRPSPDDDSSELMLEYAGVGILLQEMESGDIMVLQVFIDTPAESSGVLIGDVIVGVDGWRVGGENPMSSVTERVRGPIGTSVALTLRDPDGEERTVDVTRAKIDLRPSVRYEFLDGTIGYLRIPMLTEELVDEASRSLPQLLRSSGLILDLRAVSYGEIESVIQLAQWFLGSGSMGGFMSRDGAYALPYRADAIAAYQRPIIVVTDSRTHGLAEMLTFLLREYKRAKVVGNQTFGRYELSRPMDLPSGGLLYVTVGRYISPRGEYLPQEGIPVDFEVELPDLVTIRSGKDVYLDTAVEVLRNP